MTPAMITEVSHLCAEVGMPRDQIERVVSVVSGFQDDFLQLRAAQELADAWERDHERAR